MSTFSERVKARKQVMVAGLISQDTKALLDKIAKATRRSKSGCMDIALREWLNQEKDRIKGSVGEIVSVPQS